MWVNIRIFLLPGKYFELFLTVSFIKVQNPYLFLNFALPFLYADVVELVDTPDLGSGAERCAGSSPSFRTSRVRRAESEVRKDVNSVLRSPLCFFALFLFLPLSVPLQSWFTFFAFFHKSNFYIPLIFNHLNTNHGLHFTRIVNHDSGCIISLFSWFQKHFSAETPVLASGTFRVLYGLSALSFYTLLFLWVSDSP